MKSLRNARRSRFVLMAWVLTTVLAGHASQLIAEEGDCLWPEPDGTPRECTLWQELSLCAADVRETKEECLDDAEDDYNGLAEFGAKSLCQLEAAISGLGCIASATRF
jgi:hypothetical protein